MSETTSEKFDLIIIGGGPGGYVAAIRASQLGLKTALIEKRSTLGGTCLNVGCIPSKALLASSEHYHYAKENFTKHGITAENLSIDVSTMLERKDKIVSNLTKGIDFLFKKNKITRILGHGSLIDKNTVLITDSEGKTSQVQADKVILATGSTPVDLPFLKTDGTTVINSDHAIKLEKTPESLLVIGGGAIGLELGSVWSRLGAKVTVIEFLPEIGAGFDAEIASNLRKLLAKQGITFHLGTKVESAEISETSVTLHADENGEKVSFTAEKVLVSVGRKPYTENLGIEKVGITLSDRNRIPVNGNGQTSVDNIYAIGDITEGPMLAHKAEEEGVAVAEHIAGKGGHISHDLIPGIIYTAPEAAGVGKTEAQLKDAGIPYNSGKFSFFANGRAMANDTQDGFVKILAHKETDQLLGVHILASNASELIAEAVAIMEFGGSSEDLARTVHAHPTMSEVLKEAALATLKRPIHG